MSLLFVHSTIDDAGLNPKEFRILAHIARRAGEGEAWPSIVSISAHCGIRKQTVCAAISKLEKLGLVSIVRSSGKANRYKLTKPKREPSPNGNLVQTGTDTSAKREPTPSPNGNYEGNPVRQSKEGNPKKARNPRTPSWNPTEVQKRLSRIFKRRHSTEWSAKEISQLNKLLKRSDFADELDRIEAAYSEVLPAGEKDFRRRALPQLLNNWSGELDKCENGSWRDAKPNGNTHNKLQNTEII